MHTAKSDTSDEYVHELLNSFMVTGRYSTILERQIAFALWQRIANVHVICNEIGALESGLAAAWLGTVPSVLAGGTLTLVVAGVTAILAPRLRKLRLDQVKVVEPAD